LPGAAALAGCVFVDDVIHCGGPFSLAMGTLPFYHSTLRQRMGASLAAIIAQRGENGNPRFAASTVVPIDSAMLALVCQFAARRMMRWRIHCRRSGWSPSSGSTGSSRSCVIPRWLNASPGHNQELEQLSAPHVEEVQLAPLVLSKAAQLHVGPDQLDHLRLAAGPCRHAPYPTAAKVTE
jgi:hypothetical protein